MEQQQTEGGDPSSPTPTDKEKGLSLPVWAHIEEKTAARDSHPHWAQQKPEKPEHSHICICRAGRQGWPSL